MSATRIIDKKKLADFLETLSSDCEVIIPTVEDGNLLFSELGSSKLEDSFKGRPIVSPKEYLFPQKEKILAFDTTDKVNVDIKAYTNDKKRVIWGIRPCDLHGIKTLDAIYLSDFVDTYYQARRKNTIMMGLNCNEPCETCFCNSCQTGPFASEAYDVVFTDLGDKYLVKVGSDAGQEAVDKIPNLFAEATNDDEKKAGELEEKSKQSFQRKVDVDVAKQNLPESWDDALWAEESEMCILCGGCNFTCPTCHCFNIEDVQCGEKASIRMRYWDSCQLGGFTQMAAENTRENQAARLRQRIFHKYIYTPDKYDGAIGCTGCGRCIEVCPVNIDITHILGRVASK
ncbi:MAG: 4Fe-4S dicluster domain-containing protein [Dehalococcoidales bacterium]|nr:4Fe-4S dicluster domain-containing protein [Dehalococcoidales bacterium]